jgi:hypothetical protein
MKENAIHSKIYDLIHNKNVENLSDEERTLIIQELGSIEKFLKMKGSINNTITYFDNEEELTPSPAILSSLKQQIQHRKNAKIQKVFAYKLPIYQALIGYAALFATAFFIWNASSTRLVVSNPQKSSTVTIIKDTLMSIVYDTVVVVKIVQPAVQQDGSKSSNNLAQAIDTSNNAEYKTSNAEYPANPFYGLQNLRLIGKQKTGISLSDDTLLSGFKFTTLN